MMTMVNKEVADLAQRSIAVSKFKAECLGLLDEVAQTGEELIVTKRGKPIARIVPVEEPPSLRGSLRFIASDEELIAPIDVEWEGEAS
jgi:prevent-host-death family protein